MNLKIFFLLILPFIMAHASSRIAKKKNRSPNFWFIIGLLFGLSGMLIIYLLPIKKKIYVGKNEEPLLSFLPQYQNDSTFWYYLNENNEPSEPISFQRLQELWRAKTINDSTYLWKEDLKDWTLLSHLTKKALQ